MSGAVLLGIVTHRVVMSDEALNQVAMATRLGYNFDTIGFAVCTVKFRGVSQSVER